MQAKQLSVEGLKHSFHVKVEASNIAQQVEAGLKATGDRVRIPGFRPGFVPLKVLKQRYGHNVQEEVLQRVMNQSVQELLTQHKLRAALRPDVKIEDYRDGADFEFTVHVETLPEIVEIDTNDITLTKPVAEISDAEIDEAMSRLAKRNPVFTPRGDKEKAKMGDVVEMDFIGKIDGVAFEGGTAKNFRLELGSNQFIDGFEEGLVGVKKGDEKALNLKFPDDYPRAEYAGKSAVFEVKVHSVDEVLPAQMNDEFAKAHGFDEIANLRNALKEELGKEAAGLARAQMKRALFDALEEKVSFEIPPTMLEMEFNNIWRRVEMARKEPGGESEFEGEDEALKEDYRKIAARRVRLGLYLSEVARKNGLQISQEELSRALMNYARMYPGQEQQVIEFYRQNPDRVDDLRGPIMEEKAVDLLLSRVKTNEEKTTFEALTKAQEAGEDEDLPSQKAAKGKKSGKKSEKK